MTNVEEELQQVFSKAIREEMDFSVLSDILVGEGWTEVTATRLSQLLNDPEQTAILEWLKHTCQGRYHRLGHRVIFEREQDATAFVLRWS